MKRRIVFSDADVNKTDAEEIVSIQPGAGPCPLERTAERTDLETTADASLVPELLRTVEREQLIVPELLRTVLEREQLIRTGLVSANEMRARLGLSDAPVQDTLKVSPAADVGDAIDAAFRPNPRSMPSRPDPELRMASESDINRSHTDYVELLGYRFNYRQLWHNHMLRNRLDAIASDMIAGKITVKNAKWEIEKAKRDCIGTTKAWYDV